jgi:hypothetical protein
MIVQCSPPWALRKLSQLVVSGLQRPLPSSRASQIKEWCQTIAAPCETLKLDFRILRSWTILNMRPESKRVAFHESFSASNITMCGSLSHLYTILCGPHYPTTCAKVRLHLTSFIALLNFVTRFPGPMVMTDNNFIFVVLTFIMISKGGDSCL